MGVGYPNPPRIPMVAPRPDAAIVKAVPRLFVSNPGDPFTAQSGGGFILPYVIDYTYPDYFIAFCGADLYNCIEIDADLVPVDDGWIVPEYTTLYLSEQIPALFSDGVFVNAGGRPRPVLLTTGVPPNGANINLYWNKWDWNLKDYVCQPSILRATPTGGSFLQPISLALPDRQQFNKLGTRLYRFALMAVWMYRRFPTHNSLQSNYCPNYTFRTWYDPSKTTLVDIR